jgi:hypothetical protein
VSDLPALDPCPYRKSGAHHLAAVIPGDDDGWLTLFCETCGAVRREPVSGHLDGTLDDLDVDEIERRIYGSKR